jgi:hypothetical protein
MPLDSTLKPSVRRCDELFWRDLSRSLCLGWLVLAGGPRFGGDDSTGPGGAVLRLRPADPELRQDDRFRLGLGPGG